jgi:monoamine oxidase
MLINNQGKNPREGPPIIVHIVDVIIVGAGLSGLTAAYTLHKSGNVAYRVVEARDRVGGRIYTVAGGQDLAAFDLGPTWIWPHHRHVLAQAGELGIERFPQFESGYALFERGPGFAPQRFLPEGQGAEAQRLVGGIAALTDRLRALLHDGSMICDQPVYKISEQPDGVIVFAHTQAGDVAYQAQHVVMTLPPRLAIQTIEYDPALPPEVVSALQGTQTWMGQAMKTLLVYDRPFWREEGLSGLAVSYAGPVQQFHDASPADGSTGALFGWLSNQSSGRKMSQPQRQEEIVRQAVRMFGPEAAEVRYYSDLNWAEERFTTLPEEGPQLEEEAPQYGHPLLQIPQFHGRLHWAATEVSPVNGGYLDGAVYIGRAIAESVLQAAR